MATKQTQLQIVVDAQDRTKGTFNALKSNLSGIESQNARLASTMKSVGAAGLVAFGGMAFLSKGIIAAGAGFEQTQIAFETMLGSAETAQKVLKDLADFAQRTPFELPQLEEASKRLLAYGTTADEIIPTLEMLGNISAGVGMDKLPQLVLAFGQVRAATKLTGMELRQFSEAGVPLLGTLAAQLGKTESQIIEMVSEGAIGFDQVKIALMSLTGEGGRFYDLMAKQSTSLGGLWSNLKDQISLTARSIGTELLPYLKPLVEQLIAMMKVVGEFVKEHPKLSAGILIAALAFTLLMAALLPIALALPGLVMIFSALGATLAFVASGPGAAIIAAVAGIGWIIYNVIGIVDIFKNHWGETWLGIQLIVANSVNAIIGLVEAMINFVIDGVNMAIRAINKVIAAAAKVPLVGKALKNAQIPELTQASLTRIDTDKLVSSASFGSSTPARASTVVNISGNTFLDQDAAEKVGDLLMSRLKLSNAV